MPQRSLNPVSLRGRGCPSRSDVARSVSTAHTAAHGHPAEHDTLVERENERRRWAVGLCTALVALVALLLAAGVAVVRDLRAVSAEPVPLGEVTGNAAPVAERPDAVAGSGAAGEGASDDGDGEEGSVGGRARGSEPTVLVHVVGQVHAPGVVEVPVGSRVVDAIDAAGRLTPEADSASVNLARPAVDGEQVYFPSPGEELPACAEPASAGAAPEIVGAGTVGGLVDLNRAGAEELQTLPGVGPALSQRILNWRATHGAFGAVDQLQDVSGIGPWSWSVCATSSRSGRDGPRPAARPGSAQRIPRDVVARGVRARDRSTRCGSCRGDGGPRGGGTRPDPGAAPSHELPTCGHGAPWAGRSRGAGVDRPDASRRC